MDSKTPADTIIYGGDVITMDENTSPDRKVEAIAIAGGIIKEVGSIERVFSHKGPKTEVIFLNQQTLMPGFIEPHQHAIAAGKIAVERTIISAAHYKSYTEIRKVMQKKIQSLVGDPSGRWALFFGWDPELIPDLPTLSAKFLDENFSTEVAIGISGQSGHVAWVNSLALSKAGVTDATPDLVDGHFVKDEAGHLTGQVYEVSAIYRIYGHAPKPTIEEYTDGFKEQWKEYACAGFTSVTELCYRPNADVDKIMTSIAKSEDCPIRVGLYRDHRLLKQNNAIGHFNDKLWEIGVKYFADGSPHCGTAAVREPFLNTPLTETLGFPPPPCYGILKLSSQDFADSVRRHTTAGKQVVVHCHGERACEQILTVYEQVLAEDPTNRCRHRMEHLGLMTPDQIARAGRVNIGLSFFVDHLRLYGNVYKTEILGEGRVNRWTPLSVATKNGITWTLHQDHPTFPDGINPFGCMKSAVTRTCNDDPGHPYGPEYRVSIHEALKAYTINAAWQLHMEDRVGSITVGKKADLVVLSDNPYHKDSFQLEEIKVVETFIEGHRNKLAIIKTVSPGVNVLQRVVVSK